MSGPYKIFVCPICAEQVIADFEEGWIFECHHRWYSRYGLVEPRELTVERVWGISPELLCQTVWARELGDQELERIREHRANREANAKRRAAMTPAERERVDALNRSTRSIFQGHMAEMREQFNRQLYQGSVLLDAVAGEDGKITGPTIRVDQS